MPLRSDLPSATDALDAKRVVDALLESVFREDGPPTTPLAVGLHGRWGSGKSSLLEQLGAKVDGRTTANNATPGATQCAYRVVKFHTWTYQHEEHLLVPLLLTLLEARPATEALKAKALKLAKVSLRYLVNRTPIAGDVAKAGAEQEAEDTKNNPPPDLSDLVKFKEQVRDVVKDIQGETKDILVILIDDLDRCHPPQRVVDLLEQIKVFLDLEGCVFVVACDRDVVCSAIETRFPGQGRAYLEKFIQLPIHLPAPQPRDLARLAIADTSPPGEPGEWEAYWGRVVEVLGHNPRRAKRLHNQYVANAAIIRASGTSAAFDDFLLVKWLLLAETVPEVLSDPGRVLRIEREMKREATGRRSHREKLGVSANLAAFLHMDSARQFGDFTRLSVYSRLSTRESEMTRARVERMVRERELFPAEITDTDFSWAFLPGADFGKCKLIRVNFSDANLTGANFSGATLTECDFSRANIKDIKLTKTAGVESTIASKEKTALLGALNEQNA